MSRTRKPVPVPTRIRSVDIEKRKDLAGRRQTVKKAEQEAARVLGTKKKEDGDE